VAAPEPIDPSFRIELPMFEGPLDLLLHLIGKHELDILDLPIAFVTEKYLAYLGLMKQLDLDVAAEYLLMAAKLAHIKSKMLLPSPPDEPDDTDEEDGDPREELIRRLLEYQKYKLVAQELGSRGIAGRDVFPRGSPSPEADGPAPLAEVGLFKLLDAFAAVLERRKGDLAFEITAERISIQERMTQIADRLKSKRHARFEDLFDDVASTYDVVVTFLALLEMCKMRLLRVYQSDSGAPLHLEYRVLDADGATPESAAAEQGAPTE
jgi:segregation and condensation protein A